MEAPSSGAQPVPRMAGPSPRALAARSSLRADLVPHPRLVATLAAAVAGLAAAAHHSAADAAISALMAAVLVVLGAIDAEHRVIPNRIVLPAAGVVLVARIASSPARSATWVLAALGAALFLLLPSMIDRSAIGMGDVKLGLLLGAGLGRGVIGALIVGFVATFPFAVAILIRGGLAARKTALPLGPFLAFGALAILIVPGLLG